MVHMSRLKAIPLLAATVLAVPLAMSAQRASAPARATMTATRFKENPLVTLATSASLGDDIAGPTVIRVPGWIDHPLGRYYMYFAHHMGGFIRLAYADALTGPWKIYEPGVLSVRDTAFFRPQPDPVENLENFYTHVASPDIYVDEVNRRLVMWTHGWWTDGKMWPVGEPAARAWARDNGYGQYTQSSESRDGLRFDTHPAITRTSYLRVFPYGGTFFGMARLGLLFTSNDAFAEFEAGTNPFRGTQYANRVRHVAVARRGDLLYIFFTAIGDAPEHLSVTTMDLRADWKTWRVSPPVDLLAPAASYECANLPDVPSEAGDIKGPAKQFRDPGVFEEDGRTFLFYSFCGEQGIAGAEITF
jgi:hypothetical protein